MNALPAYVRHKGDPDAGSILLRLDLLTGQSIVLSQIRGDGGRREWLMATGPEPVDDVQAEEYITRRIDRDPDIWVVEIEDRDRAYEPDAPVVS